MAMATKVEPAGLSAAVPAHAARASRIQVGLIDEVRLRREQLTAMLAKTHPDLHVVPFPHVAACLDAAEEGLDVILYCGPDHGSSLAGILESVTLLRETCDIPVVAIHACGLPVQRSELRNVLDAVAPRPPRPKRATNPVRPD
jgi:hypothetical protein